MDKKKIVLWKGVKYYGKVASKVATFEIFFNKLRLVVEETPLGTIISLRKKNTDSYEKVWLKVDDKKIFSLSKGLDYIHDVRCPYKYNFFHRDKFVYRMKETGMIYRIRDVYKIEDMLMFIYGEAFVVLHIDNEIKEVLLNDDQAIEYHISKSGFTFFYK